MKTKVKRLSKRTLALMLCFLMMISALGLGTLITANAATITFVANQYLYLVNFKPTNWGDYWMTSDSKAWIHMWGGTGGERDYQFSLYSGTAGASGAVYRAKVENAGTYTTFILTRNSSAATGPWDNKWNQTGNISFSNANVNSFTGANNGLSSVTQSYYAVTPSSVSAEVTNANSGSGTSSDPYLVDAGASFNVKLTGTHADPGMTGFGWNIGSTSSKASSGTSTTYTKSYTASSTANTTTSYTGYAWSYKYSTSYYSSSYATSNTIYVKTVAVQSNYTVTYGKVTGYTNGSVSTTPSVTSGNTVTSGTSVTFTASPSSGYEFNGWYTSAAGSGSAVSTNASYTKSITSNTTLYAKFVPAVTITAGSVSNGSLSISYTKPDGTTGTLTSGSATAWSGKDVTVTATADSGYYVTKIGSDTVSGDYPNSGSKTYSSVSSAATYTATFAEIPDITFYVCNDAPWSNVYYYIYTGNGGATVGDNWPGTKISSTAIGTINDKNVYQITLPKATYPRSSAKCLILNDNGSNQYNGNGAVSLTDGYIYYTSDKDASEADTYSASMLDAPAHNVTFTPSPTGGTVKVGNSSTSPYTAREGDTYNIVATPSDGYYVASISNGTTLYTGSESATGAKTVSGTMGTSDQTVTVTFSKIHYTVSTSGSNFTFTTYSDSARTTTASSFTYGDTVYYTITPSSGYRVSSVKVGSAASTSNSETGAYNGSFEITANTTVTITTTQFYTVTVNKGANVTSYKTSHASYTETYTDTTKAFIVDKNAAFNITNIAYAIGYEDNASTNTTNSSVTSNITAELKAKKSTYNITKSVTPSTYASNVTVDSTGQYNDSKSVSVTVPSGYTLGSVTANSTPVTMSGTTGTVTGTFKMPAAAVTLTVTFTAKTQTVAYTAKCGDSTIKTYTSRTVSVPAGETVTADATLTVNNVKYTFSSWQYSGLSGTPTVNNTARTITYNPVEDSNSGSITAIYTETAYTVKIFGRFATDSAQVNWNDNTSSIAFTKTSTVGLYKLDTGKTVYQLSQNIQDTGGYSAEQYFYIKQDTTAYGYSSGNNQATFQNATASSKITLSSTSASSHAMRFDGSDNTKLVTLWYDAATHQIWCSTADQAHSVTFPANGTGYTISNAGTTVSYNYGDTVTFDVTPATGYGIDSVTWAGSSESGTATNTSGNTYTFTMPNEDVTTITVTASEVPYESAKNVTYYIDFHDNTLSANPTIKFGSNAAVALTKVTSYNGANIYSATVSTPYYYHYITGNANTAIEDIDAVINANGNDYDITIDKSVIHSGECECWIESQGTVDTTNVPTTRHTVSNSTDTKRIYLHKKDNSTWYGNWVDVYMYYKKQDGTQYSGVEWGSTNAVQKMNYLSKIDNYYVYYLDVPEDAFYFKPYGKNNGTTYEMSEMGDQIEMYGNNELYLNDDDNNRWSYGNSAVAPFISDYYDTVTIQNGNSTSVAPTATGTVTYSYTGSTYYTLYTNGSITAKAQGSGTVTITATGTYGDTVTAQTSVTVKNASVTGDFSVMSYDSISTTLNSGDGVTIDSVSTKLYGTKANGSTSAIVNGGGIVTKSGNNFTATYAAPEASTGYGSLAMRVTASVTPDGDDYYFDGWYKGGNEKSTVYTSENDDIRVDGYNYTLNFSQIDTYTVTITYNYKEYTAGGAYSDSGATANKTYTPDSIKFRGDITTDDCKELAVENCPNLISDYFNYRLITGNTSGYAFSASINTTNKTAAVTAYLKESARKYKVYVDGTKFGNKTYTYQEEVELRAGEVGYDDDTNLNWYEGAKRMATGTSYNIRVTGDTELTTSVNSALENNNGKSIISYKSHELMLDTNGVQKLTQNFYIADFCNAELGGEDGEANFVGGGVLYYAVDKTTGKATKATANSKGEASESTLRSAVENVVNGNYNSDLAKDTADSASKITCRYKQLDGNEGIYKFSSDLQAYQYIYSSTMTNNKAYENYTYRVYSYFVYEVNGEYHISVSDNYADADFYVAE